MNIKTPLLAVDCIIFKGNSLLLIKRKNEPFKDCYALPGGFVKIGENVEQACMRETYEETNLHVSKLKLVGVYSNPKRDPRGHIVSIAFLAKPESTRLKAGSDAVDARFIENWNKMRIAFDHKNMIKDALKKFNNQN